MSFLLEIRFPYKRDKGKSDIYQLHLSNSNLICYTKLTIPRSSSLAEGFVTV